MCVYVPHTPVIALNNFNQALYTYYLQSKEQALCSFDSPKGGGEMGWHFKNELKQPISVLNK